MSFFFDEVDQKTKKKKRLLFDSDLLVRVLNRGK
jgi:hypothetical protein